MAKTYFKQKDMKPIIEKYGLSKTFKGKSIYERLQGTADIYFLNKERFDEIQSNQETKEELTTIEKSINRLTKQMEKLSPSAKTAFSHTVAHFHHLTLIASMQGKFDPALKDQWLLLENGAMCHRLQIEDNDPIFFSYDESDFERALRNLAVYVKASKDGIRQRQAGRRQSMGLRLWVTNIASIWRDYKGEPFKVTYPKGQPKSPAARFCVEALRLIDCDAQRSKIVTAMRTYVSEERKRISGNGGQKILNS